MKIKNDKNKLDTQTTCYFKSQFNNYDEYKGPKYGIIPLALKNYLIKEATKKKMKQQKLKIKRSFRWFQLSYKVTANSVYGAMGAKTSSILLQNCCLYNSNW